MSGWLNANSAAIQALGSAATVLLTAVLAWVTWRYVKLTQRLVSVQLGEAAARRRELRTQLDLVAGFLSELALPDDHRPSSANFAYFNDLRDCEEAEFGRWRQKLAEKRVIRLHYSNCMYSGCSTS